MYAPIVLFVYNRVDLFLKTYEALKLCDEAKDSELFIFSDGAKNEKSEESVTEVRKSIRAVCNEKVFKKISIIESEQNKGLAKSIIEGVTQVIEKYGRAIVLEDDCMPSKYFLGYMNAALDKFEKDKTIGSIAGYSQVIPFPVDYTSDIYLARRSCSWGWATWRDRWINVDWEMNGVNKIYSSPKLIHRLNCNGSDRLIRLHRQSQGKAGSWSIRFGAHHAMMNWWVVYPRFSYIWCTGNDGSGVHTKVGDITSQSDLSLAIARPDLTKPKVDLRIQKLLKKAYSGGTISDIKRFMATLIIFVKGTIEKI